MPKMGCGPVPARIMLVGEAFGEQEERAGEPFIGASGQALNSMLHEANIMRSECYCTNVVNARPPMNDLGTWIAAKKKDITQTHLEVLGRWVLPIVASGIERLQREITLVQPNIIVALGATPLWALTGATGIMKWRGSQLKTPAGTKLIPVIHPAAVLRQWELRSATVQDLKRVAKEAGSREYGNEPKWNFLVRPSFNRVADTLNQLLFRLDSLGLDPEDTSYIDESAWGGWIDFDLETRAGHIACAGISWSLNDALCIPLMCVESKDGYWSLEEEASIVYLLYRLLTHPRVRVRGQNLLYDCQYTWRHWHFVPRVAQDTMISHHTMFAGLPKRLDYQASIYCDHYLYWKDDGKTWTKDVGEDQLWAYNCVDCVRTREVGEVEARSIESMGLASVEAFQQKLFWPVLKAMQLGVRIDQKARAAFALELQEEMSKREAFFHKVLGHPLNPNSHPQMTKLFYNDLGIPPVMSRGKKGAPSHVTCDDEALDKIMVREPLARPIVRAIKEYRSLGVFLSTFVLAPLDIDSRMRCSYNICGTETYRFNSSKNAFGSGTNLQNVPKGGEEDGLTLPNVRKLFVPDPGFTFFDMDLDRADLQVVVWEADDAELKAALRMGVDMHLLNAYTLAQKELPPLEELVEGHPKYLDHRIPYKKERQLAKSFIHGCVVGEHEALTPNGWMPVHLIRPTDFIMVCSPDGKESHYEIPDSWWQGPCHTELLHFRGESVEQLVTFDHRMPYRTDRHGMKVGRACDLPQSARLPKSITYNGPIVHPNPKLLAAYHADGSQDPYGNVTWHLRKSRKIDRLERRLQGCEFTRSDYEDSTVFYLPRREVDRLLLGTRTLDSSCLHWSHETAVAYLEEQVYWDGHQGPTGGQWMSSVDKQRADLCHTLAHLHGYGSQRNTVDRPDRQTLYRWSLNHRTEWRLSSTNVRSIPNPNVQVYCPKTSTGFWLTRYKGKISVTGNTNYGGGARTMAVAAGVTVHQADRFQKIYFGRYPGLKAWHERTEIQLRTHHFVENKFGYRRYYFDRIDGLLPEALAWIPQSTVANYIDRVWLNIFENLPQVQVLLQVHDSICGQVPTHRSRECIDAMKAEAKKVYVPYDDPLIIPVGVKVSEVSWGACE